jgi:hypothetical protein
MQIGDEIDENQIACLHEQQSGLVEGQVHPPALPSFTPVDLRALANQLPDLSCLENLTVNFQANTYTPPPENSLHLHALAQDTDARLGHLRNEIKQSLEQGNYTITERFQKIGSWC